ncbi:DNA topoisomerase (ATP-hydrolyzing) subunit B [bacterium]|nr:DNA topoisomerase (ATP-hydrolyzing) subunit B [bacterium]
MNDYNAKNIKVLEGLEGVRKRPSMYIGSTGMEGLHHLIYEVVDNSIDEALAGYCDHIKVNILKGDIIEVEDNGRGIPVDMHAKLGISGVEVVMTKLHAGGKFDHKTYKVSGGLHGVGVSVVNALAEWLEVEVYRDGYRYKQSYKRGFAQTKLIKTELPPEKKNKKGTKIIFKADPQIFEVTTYDFNIVNNRMKELAFLNKSLKIEVADQRDYPETKNLHHYEGGIISFIEHLNSNREPIHQSIVYVEREEDNIAVEVAMQYTEGYSSILLSFVNNINTREGGTHLVGFKSALTRVLNEYGKNFGLLKEKISISGDDSREGLTMVMSLKLPEPQFEGQTKTKLGNSEVKGLVSSMVYDALKTYFEEHPQDAKKIISKTLLAMKAREAARRARDLTRKKSAIESGSLPGKLADCSSKDKEITEVYIVEGISAGGSAKQGRNRETQAILPLRGKILNIEKASLEKMLANEQIRNLVTAIGCGIGNEFDITKLRYGKIIIMTDADVDGSHIRTLLLTFFFRHMLPLIEEGYIYSAQPPLFRIKKGQKIEYIKNENQMENFLLNHSVENITFEVINNKTKEKYECEKIKIKETVKDIEVLMKEEETLSLFNLKLEEFLNMLRQYKDIKTLWEKVYIKSFNNEDSIFNKEEVPIPLTNIMDLIKKIEETHNINLINGQYTFLITDKVGVLDFNNPFEIPDRVKEYGKKGYDIQRYKGLGEMNPEQLWDTTMNPETRTLLRVIVEDFEECDNTFSVLMGDDVAKRRAFIESRALKVKNLDI